MTFYHVITIKFYNNIFMELDKNIKSIRNYNNNCKNISKFQSNTILYAYVNRVITHTYRTVISVESLLSK